MDRETDTDSWAEIARRRADYGVYDGSRPAPRRRGSPDGQNDRTFWLALGTGAVLGTAGLYAWHRKSAPDFDRFSDDAPGRSAWQSWFGDYGVSGNTVTIGKPRAEVYKFWRDFKNLPRFMENIESVETGSNDVSRWRVKAPGDTAAEVMSRIVSDRPNAEIAWASTDDSQIETCGKVMFRDAPGDRGTEVEAIDSYVPPAGALGRMIAKLLQREPEVQGRRDLKRLKMLMETGEIATARNRATEDTEDRGQ